MPGLVPGGQSAHPNFPLCGQHHVPWGIPLASPSLAGKSLMQMGSGEHKHSTDSRLGGTMARPLRLLRAEGPSREQGDLTGRPWALGGQWSLPTQRQTLLSTRVATAMTVPLYQKYPGPKSPLREMSEDGKRTLSSVGARTGALTQLSPKLHADSLHHPSFWEARTFPN